MDCTGLSTVARFHSWRHMRRAAQEALTKTTVQRYYPILTKEATILASTFLSNPKNRDQHFQRAIASMMLSILYDSPTLTSTEDKVIQDVRRALNSSLRAAVGTSLVEFFPWMIYVPQRFRLSLRDFKYDLTSKDRFAKWKREALQRSAERTEMFLRLFNRVKADIVCPLIQICR
jgi:hypothetical protein